MLAHGAQDAGQLRGREQRGSAATYIYTAHTHAATVVSSELAAALADFMTQGTDVRLHLRPASGGVEVAIDAARLAKRDVDVQTGHIATAKVAISWQRTAPKTKKMIKQATNMEKKHRRYAKSQLFFLPCGRFRQKQATNSHKTSPRKQKCQGLNPWELTTCKTQ